MEVKEFEKFNLIEEKRLLSDELEETKERL